MCLPRAHPPKSCSSLDRAGHCHKVPFLSGELWSNIFSKVKSIFCPDQELGVQPKRNDQHLFLPGQPQHPRQQVKDPSKMLGFPIFPLLPTQFSQLLHLLLRFRGIPIQLQRSRQNPLLVERAAFQETTIHNIRDHRNLKYWCFFFSWACRERLIRISWAKRGPLKNQEVLGKNLQHNPSKIMDMRFYLAKLRALFHMLKI